MGKTVAKLMKQAGIRAPEVKKFCVSTWLYLAAVEDLYSRKIAGWSMSERIDSRLVADALKIAVNRELSGEGLIAHSDRSVQYASDHYQRVLKQHGVIFP